MKRESGAAEENEGIRKKNKRKWDKEKKRRIIKDGKEKEERKKSDGQLGWMKAQEILDRRKEKQNDESKGKEGKEHMRGKDKIKGVNYRGKKKKK